MLRFAFLGLSILATASAVACGGSSSSDGGGSGGSGGGGGSIPFSELADRYAEALCQATARCFDPVFDLFLQGRDCETMVGEQIGASEFPRIEAAIAAGRVTYDASKAPACVAALAARACDALTQREPPECQAALDGTVEVGGDCTLDAECKGQTYCKSSGACPGQCAALEPAGGRCTDDGDCQPGLQCPGETLTCARPSAVGEDCGGGVAPDCAPGSLCLGDDQEEGVPGKCRSITSVFVGDVGASCGGFVSGGSDFTLCKPNLSCALSFEGTSLSGQCVEKFAANGPCKASFPDGCPAGQFCDTPTSPPSLDGTCRPVPKAGERCGSPTSDGLCEPYHVCVFVGNEPRGTCRPMADNGAPCTTADQCWSGRCERGACAGNFACQ